MNYSTMTIAELLAAAESHLEREDDLQGVLQRAAELARDSDPTLSLLLSVLSGEPSEIAAMSGEKLGELGKRLSGDSAVLCRVASNALLQFEID